MNFFRILQDRDMARAGTKWPESAKAKRASPNNYFKSKEDLLNGFPEDWDWFPYNPEQKPPVSDIHFCCTNGLVFSKHAFDIVQNEFPIESGMSHDLIIDGVTYIWVMPLLIDEKDVADTELNFFMSGPLYEVLFSDRFVTTWNNNKLNASTFIKVNESESNQKNQVTPLKISRSKLEFKRFVKSKGYKFKGITPVDAVRLMMDFFVSVTAEGFKYRDDNMLLFQWDSIDWNDQEMYMLDITRQFTTYFIDDEYNDECPIYTQLGMTFFFPITDSLREIKGGNIWAHGVNDINRFQKYVLENPVLLELGNRNDYADFSFERSVVG